MYGYICPFCGCHLDPQEKCDCREEKELKKEKLIHISNMIKVEKSGQMKMVF